MRVSIYNLPDPEEILLPPVEEETIDMDYCYLCDGFFALKHLHAYEPILPHLTCLNCMNQDKELVNN